MLSFVAFNQNKKINGPSDRLLSWSEPLRGSTTNGAVWSSGSIKEQVEIKLREQYKIIEVDWLDPTLVEYKIFSDTYFKNACEKKAMVKKMMDYYLNHIDKKIYKKIDYLCNEKERICICNVNADAFRKIYDGQNYVPEYKYISYFKEE